MNIMAGGTGLGVEIDLLALHWWVIPDVLSMATGADFGLRFYIAHRIRFFMRTVTV